MPYNPHAWVSSTGPRTTPWAVVGDVPSVEDTKRGPLSGPAGSMLWPLMLRLARKRRDEVYVTTVCPHPLVGRDDTFSYEEALGFKKRILDELAGVRPSHVLAVGTNASRILLGEKFISMEACNGMTYDTPQGWTVTPCWHPNNVFRPGDEEKDSLSYVADAIYHWHPVMQRKPKPVVVPPWKVWEPGTIVYGGLDTIAVDTEGTVEDPICLTWATDCERFIVDPKFVPQWWDGVARPRTLVFHNAPYDWGVMEALGIRAPWEAPFADTMELAYLRQTEPRGLKALAYRHFGVPMRDYVDVVMPHYEEAVRAVVAGMVEAGTTTITHTAKGKLRKKPQFIYTEEAKRLRRVSNLKILAQRIGWWDGVQGPEATGANPPTLRHVLFEELAEYASLDPFMTLKVWEVLK